MGRRISPHDRAMHKIIERIDRNTGYHIPYEHILEILLVEAYVQLEEAERDVRELKSSLWKTVRYAQLMKELGLKAEGRVKELETQLRDFANLF